MYALPVHQNPAGQQSSVWLPSSWSFRHAAYIHARIKISDVSFCCDLTLPQSREMKELLWSRRRLSITRDIITLLLLFPECQRLKGTAAFRCRAPSRTSFFLSRLTFHCLSLHRMAPISMRRPNCMQGYIMKWRLFELTSASLAMWLMCIQWEKKTLRGRKTEKKISE